MPGARYTPSYGSGLADWAGAAAAGRPAGGVLVQTSFLGSDNDELRAELRREPALLRGVAVVDPLVGGEALAALHRDGVRGIRLNLAGVPGDAAAAARLPRRLADDLAALGWHVELHTDAGLLPAVLAQVDARLEVVLDHFGRPASADAGDPTFEAVRRRLAAGGAPVHVKLSAPYRLGGLPPGALARLWRDAVGVERLLWGSDWPCTNHEAEADYPRLLSALDDWIADPAERRRILLDNPRRLYWR